MSAGNNDIYIRVNQVGFLRDDVKTAVILSNVNLAGSYFELVENTSGINAYKGNLGPSKGKYASFRYIYQIDFSKIKKYGTYQIKIKGSVSPNFVISENPYKGIVDSLMQFFKIQRCGYTNPEYHKTCHRFDATHLLEGEEKVDKKVDLTGGWHDAADYVKFLNTTAFTTYTLLFSFEFDKSKFDFDNDKSGVPDILEEAKVGLDWLLRCNYEKLKLISQVQDLKDHEVGMRMPEDDPLENDRVAFVGMGKNTIGIYVATMALAYKIWTEKFEYSDFANQCLTAAENLYSVRTRVPNIDKSGTGHYVDNDYEGKLALAAIEMYRVTKRDNYFDDAIKYADAAGPDHWWSYGNINSYAHYRIAEFRPEYKDYIESNLKAFTENSSKRIFGEASALTWGSNHTMLGVTLQNILYKKLTSSNDYDVVSDIQRDYMLGRNPWGLSFFVNIGESSVENLHHQVSHLLGIKLPGGFSAGPVPKKYLESQKINFLEKDKYDKFQDYSAVFRDDIMDFITNEPTISANATAVFVMGCLSKP